MNREVEGVLTAVGKEVCVAAPSPDTAAVCFVLNAVSAAAAETCKS